MVMTISEQKSKIIAALMDLHFQSGTKLIDDVVSSFVDWAADMTKAFYNDSGMYIDTDNCRRLNIILTYIMENVAATGRFKWWSAGYFNAVAGRLIEQVTFTQIS